MSQLNNSFSTATNVQFGSKDLKDVWFNAQSCNIPSISLAHPKIGGRAGAGVFRQADTVEYSDLNIDVILDSNWEIYDKLYTHFLDGLNVETGVFKEQVFDLWLDIKKGNGEQVKKFWFYNCRLADLGELPVSTTDDGDELHVISLSFQFDYMDYDNNFTKARFN